MTQRAHHERTLQASAAERERVLPLLKDYMARTGLGVPDFARRINYAYSTLNLFLNDKYHHVAGTHTLMCRAIEDYILQNPVEAPQEVFGQLYETQNALIIRRTIEKLFREPAGFMIYGPPGSQKSFTLRYEAQRINREEAAKNGHGRRVFYLQAKSTQRTKAEITPQQLMRQIATACGTPAIGDIPRIERNLAYDFRNRRVVLVIDEAQRLTLPCLEMVRDLMDEPPYFSLLLAGMQSLLVKFAQYAHLLGQWNDRLRSKLMLPGLSPEEAQMIAQAEMPGISAARMGRAIKLAARIDGDNNELPYINVRSLVRTVREMRVLEESE